MSNSDKTARASRRHFLKTSGMLTGAALGTNLLMARSAHAAGSDVLKVGLIGCGGRGTGAALNALNTGKDVKLTAMADVFPEKIQLRLAAIKRHMAKSPEKIDVPPERQFVGFDAYQKLIDSGVDVVVMAATPHFRPRHLKAAVDAGKHVFCEKPVAVDAPGVRSVIETAKKAKEKNLSICAGLCWRYNDMVREVMKRVHDGQIGDITSTQDIYITKRIGTPVRRQPEMTEMEFQLRNWYFFTWLSGDFNVEQHVHSLDKALWAMGDVPPVQAWGTGGRTFFDREGDIYDHYAVVYEYPNGVKVHSYCRQQDGCFDDVSDDFIGTKGHVHFDSFTAQMEGQTNWDRRRKRGEFAAMYQNEHNALFKAIRTNEPINHGDYMANSTMMAILGRMVGATGKRITWEQAMNSKQVLAPAEYTWDATPPTTPDKDGKYPLTYPGITKFV
ncbi:MAG: Gfo/Idh/MocA family oxidoreductase [Pirellulales bacterium]|nr:Gfo/Idh/MocA family oxidoreductase [Pirellulales bacterium]